MIQKDKQEVSSFANGTRNAFLDTLCYSGVSYIAHQQMGEHVSTQFQAYVVSLIHLYDKQALRKKIAHNILQFIIFIGAAAATILISFSKVIPAILTGTVTVATAITNYYKFGENSQSLERVAEDLAFEYNRHITKRGIYAEKTLDAALYLFMERVESILREQRQRANALEEVKLKNK